LDSYESALGLEPGKLAASRHVLISEYGNMMGAMIFFLLDEICRRCEEDAKKNCRVMSGLGPRLTIETIVLHATGSKDEN
jgi:predicted naringenin-chalcone synthase